MTEQTLAEIVLLLGYLGIIAGLMVIATALWLIVLGRHPNDRQPPSSN